MLPWLSDRLVTLFSRGSEGRRRMRRSAHGSSVFATAARVWSEVADARGLEAVDDPMRRELRYAGAIRGLPCELALEDTGESFATWLTVERTADLPAAVRVVRAAPMAALAARILRRRHASGDADFDAVFLITSASALAVTMALDEDARAALLAVAHRLPELNVSSRAVALRMQGVELGHDALLALIDALVRAPTAAAMPYR
ncbi:MAG: hypothetical protein WKG00_41095 [Polyangiaceae bacterium]